MNITELMKKHETMIAKIIDAEEIKDETTTTTYLTFVSTPDRVQTAKAELSNKYCCEDRVHVRSNDNEITVIIEDGCFNI